MLQLLGIILVIAIFVFSGINKILNFNSNVDSLSKKFNYIKNVPHIIFTIIIIIAIIIVIGAPIIILCNSFNYIGNDIARYAVISLLIFTVIATLLYHLPTDDGQTIHFLKNLSLIGGLLLYYDIL